MDAVEYRVWLLEARLRSLRIGTDAESRRAKAAAEAVRELELELSWAATGEADEPTTDDYTVHITGCDGTDVEGAVVELRQGSASGTLIDSATTDASGEAVLTGPVLGSTTLYLVASRTGYTSNNTLIGSLTPSLALSSATGWLCFTNCNEPFHVAGGSLTAITTSTLSAALSTTQTGSGQVYFSNISANNEYTNGDFQTPPVTFAGNYNATFAVSRDATTGHPKLTVTWRTGSITQTYPTRNDPPNGGGGIMTVVNKIETVVSTSYSCHPGGSITWNLAGLQFSTATGVTTATLDEAP
jgi:hypothetical protein